MVARRSQAVQNSVQIVLRVGKRDELCGCSRWMVDGVVGAVWKDVGFGASGSLRAGVCSNGSWSCARLVESVADDVASEATATVAGARVNASRLIPHHAVGSGLSGRIHPSIQPSRSGSLHFCL